MPGSTVKRINYSTVFMVCSWSVQSTLYSLGYEAEDSDSLKIAFKRHCHKKESHFLNVHSDTDAISGQKKELMHLLLLSGLAEHHASGELRDGDHCWIKRSKAVRVTANDPEITFLKTVAKVHQPEEMDKQQPVLAEWLRDSVA